MRSWSGRPPGSERLSFLAATAAPVLLLLCVIPLSHGSSSAPASASSQCHALTSCASCILTDSDCFWNISTSSCVYIGDIAFSLESTPNVSKRHLSIENITNWLLLQPSAALDLRQCPDLQCPLVYVSFSYISCSPKGQLTFVSVSSSLNLRRIYSKLSQTFFPSRKIYPDRSS